MRKRRVIDGEAMLDFFGSFEDEGKSSSLTKKVLMTIGFSGIIVSGMVAPGMLRAVDISTSKRQTFSGKQISSKMQYLKKNGLILISEQKDGSKKILLSVRGREKLSRYYVKTIKIRKPILWDRKWRVVIFDVPVEKNSVRIHFRNILKEWGFFQVQRSIWVFPYDCEDEVFFLSKMLHIDEYVDILIVDKFYNDQKFKQIFFSKK